MPQAMRFGLILLLLAGLFAALTPAWAQEVTAAIVGTVVDPSGAPINGATVTATDTERGTVWTAKTNEVGAYNLTRLPVGTYSVKVSAEGFQTAVQPPFVLVLNQAARVDVQMKMGQVTEQVEVMAATPLLQTQSTEVSTLIDSNTAESLPLASRNYLQLSLLSPGATNPNPQTLYNAETMPSSGRPYINGNREQANAYYLDGVINREDNNNEVGFTPSPDAIQEFNVITQNPSAEFGDFQGGVVSASIKSGTNNFHGNVFEFLRNDALNANTWSAGLAEGNPNPDPHVAEANGVLKKPKLRWNMFGATLGGPIVKNKLFFFADYQGQRFDRPGNAQGYQLFTPQEVSGNFGQLCTDNGGSFTAGICSGGTGIQLVDPANGNTPFLSNMIPVGRINSTAQALFSLPQYHAAQQHAVNVTNAPNFFAPISSQLNSDQGDLKVDFNATDSDHVFFRWSQAYIDNPTSAGFFLADPGKSSTEPIKTSVVNWTHTFNANLLNEFRAGFVVVRYREIDNAASQGNLAEQLHITGGNAFTKGLPVINIGSISYGENGLLQDFHTGTGELEDSLIMTHGHHNIKTGFQFWRKRLNYTYPGNNGTLGTINIANLTGSPQADFFLGNISGGGRDAGQTEFGRRGNVFGAYVQDDWRVTHTLTLNLGLRFEGHPALYEIHNREVNIGIIDGVVHVEQNHQPLYHSYWGIGDWLPRVGFAWSPAALGGKTVIRGAIGLSSFAEGGGANQLLTQNDALTQVSNNIIAGSPFSSIFANSSAPCTVLNQACFQGPTRGVSRIKVWDPHFRPGVEQQWNLSIQHQFNNSTTAQLGYVGSFGTHLLNLQDYAQLELVDANGRPAAPGVPGVALRPTPFIAGGTASGGQLYTTNNFPVNALGPASNSNQSYNALQAVLKKTMSNGLEGQVAYTYSKCLSNSPGFYGTGTWGGNGSQTYMGLPGWQNIYDPRSDWGPCYYDETHILSAFATYQIPIGRGKRFGRDLNPVANAVIGNWELAPIITWHTGNAVTALNGAFSNHSGTGGDGILDDVERPNCLSAPRYPKQKVNIAGAGFIQWWAPSTFVLPTPNDIPFTSPVPGEFGNCRVGTLRGPRYSTTDLSLHKDFLFTETKRLEFRAEFINLFNHPILDFAGGPGPFSLSGNFGQISASQGERNIQFALKFYF
jgi:Carboxypeptidase regulatory-like domain/TonB dependent receptor